MPYWAEEEMETILRLHQAVLEGKAPGEGFEIRLKRKSGERFDALIFEAPLIDGEGEHVGWMGSVMDITDRNRARDLLEQQQERLQHTARLVAMGEMASTLAHELNQPLSAITSYTSGCINKLESGNFMPGDLVGALKKMAVQEQRAGRIIRQVHDFVRKREPRRESCAVAEVVDDNVALFEAEARKRGVRILRRFQGGLPEIQADPHMLGQVLFNLMRNGVEAMQDIDPALRLLELGLSRDANQIIVSVADSGHGIPADTAEKLFTPFFTTKSEGMGMGLAICRSIIEFHHGRLWLESNPTGGTVFLFSLPIEAP
jgi:two-component system sensor histidine kinase DctS